ncbi:CotY/CotZ family spore coat protein [Bacillus thuringiensis]|uniref:CotY/CotZ family spore coat protein n=1 Tax=Bacillus thuringiensis TaxID=1428 RepID=UPI0034584515
MSSNYKKNSYNCVCEVVRFIYDLQEQRACPKENFLTLDNIRPNTRPFVLYTAQGSLFQTFFPSLEDSGCCSSSIFRVEEIDNCCAVLRTLAVLVCNVVQSNPIEAISHYINPVEDNSTRIVATSTCIVVDLNVFLGIQCLPDTSL